MVISGFSFCRLHASKPFHCEARQCDDQVRFQLFAIMAICNISSNHSVNVTRWCSSHNRSFQGRISFTRTTACIATNRRLSFRETAKLHSRVLLKNGKSRDSIQRKSEGVPLKNCGTNESCTRFCLWSLLFYACIV